MEMTTVSPPSVLLPPFLSFHIKCLGVCFYNSRLELFKRIRIDGGGNADHFTAFLNPDDLTPALHLDRACRINVFQHDGELYRLPGGEGAIRLEEYPGAVEVAGYAFAALEFDW